MPSSYDDDEGPEATGLKKRRNLSPLLQQRGSGGRGLRLRMENGLGRAVEYCLTKWGQALCPALNALLNGTPAHEQSFALERLWASAKPSYLGFR